MKQKHNIIKQTVLLGIVSSLLMGATASADTYSP